ncbi:hypothetical protein BJ742DRAFT_684038 [Cladochytrium replicatum]|nr:hypothetical protein BJ742DRAFT_684038 [Cladochytrium replicatum]
MSKATTPELKKYMDKKLFIQLNGNRKVTGILRGFDPFMNIVLDDVVEEISEKEKKNIGMVVIRGNSITVMEALDRIGGGGGGGGVGGGGGPPV